MFVCEAGRTLSFSLAVMGCNSCSRAPMIEVIGTFFPAWMFCIAAGVVVAGLVRLELSRRGVEKKLGPLVIFYPGVALAVSCLLWLIVFA